MGEVEQQENGVTEVEEVEQLEAGNQDNGKNQDGEEIEEVEQLEEENNPSGGLKGIIPESGNIEDMGESGNDKKTRTVKDKIIKLFLETPRKEFLKLIGSVDNENFGLLLSQILEDYLSLSS